MNRRPAHTRFRGDGGFTLPEMLMTIVILGIIVVPLAAIYFVAIHDTVGISDRVIHSHDIQNAAVLFTRDVQNADTVVTPTNSTIVGGVRVSASQLGLHGIAFADASRGWAVGDQGTIAHTDDGGFTWTVDDPITSANLWAVDMVADTDANKTVIGFAVGDGGLVLKYNSNSGWSQVSAGVSGGVTLQAVSIKKSEGDITKNKVMVAGTGGTVAFSKDSGATWTAKNTGGSQNLRGVAYKDADSGKNAWIVGDGGYIARGCDIGGSCTTGWTTPVNAGSGNLTAISMLSGATNAIVVGNGGAAYSLSKAKDNNPTINPSPVSGVTTLTGVAVADNDNAWASGVASDGTGSIWFCESGCTTTSASWTQQDDGTSEILREVATRDKFHVWAVGDNVTIATAVINGWAPELTGTVDLYAAGGKAPDATWAAGASGTTLFRTTGWASQTTGTNPLFGLGFKDDGSKGLAVGANGTVLFNGTTNTGGSWAASPGVPTTNELHGVGVGDDNTAVAAGLGGVIVTCTNKCFTNTPTWAPLVTGIPLVDYYGVSMENKDRGLVVGANGTILVTANGGTTWTPQATPVDLPVGTTLYGVYIKDKDNAVIVGSGGVILRCDHPAGVDCDTSAASATRWVLDGSPTGADLRGLFWASDTSQWAVGAGGTVVRYDGSSWEAEDTGVGNDFFGVAAFTSGTGCTATAPCVFVVGTGGQILSKQNPTPALWSAQQLNELLYVTAPVCAGGQPGSGDTFVGSFAYKNDIGDTSTTYVLRDSAGEHQLVRQICTRTSGNATDPFDAPVEVVAAHYVVGAPTLPDTCYTTMTCTMALSGGAPPDTFDYALTGTRRNQ